MIEKERYIDGWHIEAVCSHFQAVYQGKITDLIVNIPPGCTKSLIANVFFPSWVWLNDATKRFFHATYDAKLSTRDSVKCRTLLESRWYQTLSGGKVSFARGQSQKTQYENTAGGYRLASSVGGHGTGEHPHFVIVDDANNVKQAESAKERQAVADWMTLTMSTRGITVGCRKINIQQRLHEYDLTGYLLEKGGYEHLCLPMRFESETIKPATSIGFRDPRTEEGQLLCPQQLNEKQIAKLEKDLGPYGTAGQLQQRPVPRSGGLFDVSQFKMINREQLPAKLKRVRYWDTSTNSGTGDYTAGVDIGKDLETNLYYIIHVLRGQWLSHERKQRQRQQAEIDGKTVTQVQAQEPGSGGADQAADFIKLMTGFTCKVRRESGAKDIRADPYASQVNGGNVYLVRGDWNNDFISEHMVAPNGKNDDQWDAAAGGFNFLNFTKHHVALPSNWSFGVNPSMKAEVVASDKGDTDDATDDTSDT